MISAEILQSASLQVGHFAYGYSLIRLLTYPPSSSDIGDAQSFVQQGTAD